MPAPSAMPRFSGGNSLLNADSTEVERTARQAETDQHAGAEIERQRRRSNSASAADRRHRAARRRSSRAACRSDRQWRPRSAGRGPTTGSAAPARGRTRRGPRRTRGPSAARKSRGSSAARSSAARSAHPQTMMTSGVRQVPRPEDRTKVAGRCSHVVFPDRSAPGNRPGEMLRELMQCMKTPRGAEKIIPPAGQLCKIGECNEIAPGGEQLQRGQRFGSAACAA